MPEILILALAYIAGMLLGTLFFGGLWWTIQRGVSSARPAFWFFGSLLSRMSIALIGFYWVSGGQADRLIACVIGFFIARWTLTFLTRKERRQRVAVAEQARHAP